MAATALKALLFFDHFQKSGKILIEKVHYKKVLW